MSLNRDWYQFSYFQAKIGYMFHGLGIATWNIADAVSIVTNQRNVDLQICILGVRDFNYTFEHIFLKSHLS